MKAFIHIGTEKTGTTSIQRFIFENEVKLNSLDFSLIKSCGFGNSRLLPAICMRDDRYDEVHSQKNINCLKEKIKFNKETEQCLRDELNKISKSKKNLLISSEHFHSRCIYKDEILNLKNILNDYYDEIIIIIYLRPQIDVATSLYSTILRSGGTAKFEDFIKSNLRLDNYYYRYDRIIENWGSVFGINNLNIRLFQRKTMVDNNLISDFFSAIGLEYTEGYNNAQPMNESLNPLYQEVYRQFNKQKLNNNDLVVFLEENGTGKGQHFSFEKESVYWKKFEEPNNLIAVRYFQRDSLFERDEKNGIRENILSNQDNLLLENLLTLTSHQLSNSEIDVIRDAALSLESTNIFQARKLMNLASKLRPTGPFITKKLKEYNTRIALQTL